MTRIKQTETEHSSKIVLPRKQKLRWDSNSHDLLRASSFSGYNKSFDYNDLANFSDINPESPNNDSQIVSLILADAREYFAQLFKVGFQQVVFCASATESNNMALNPSLFYFGDKKEKQDFTDIFISSTEHSSVASATEKWLFYKNQSNVSEQDYIIPIMANGGLDSNRLQAILEQRREQRASCNQSFRPLVSVIHSNNESGVIQPLSTIKGIVSEYNGILHSDCTQSIGRLARLDEIAADMISFSAHKCGGPLGFGCLILKDANIFHRHSVVAGGKQEQGWRAGTANIAVIKGAQIAIEEAQSEIAQFDSLSIFRDKLELLIKTTFDRPLIYGKEMPRLANTSFFALPKVDQQVMLFSLDKAGIHIGSGSACNSGVINPSLIAKAFHDALKRASRGFARQLNHSDYTSSFRISWSYQLAKQKPEQISTEILYFFSIFYNLVAKLNPSIIKKKLSVENAAIILADKTRFPKAAAVSN